MNDIGRLVDWTVSNLPGDIALRRQILNGLYLILPSGTNDREGVATLLGHLDQHLGAQKEFTFQRAPQPEAEVTTRGGRRLSDREQKR